MLGSQQSTAFYKILDFLNSDKIGFSLEGYAGTGKSYMITYIIKHLNFENIPYSLVAPTHKAAMVLKNFTKENDVMTLHKLLTLSPKLDILELDFNQLEFFSNGLSKGNIPYKGVIICDEASMINDDLFEFLIEKIQEQKSKIIFVSDSKQLQPVKNQKLSKVYDLEDRFELTEIFRQKKDCGYSDILLDLRNKDVENFETKISDFGSLYVINSLPDFLKTISDDFKSSDDILRCKVISYTNKRVELFNKQINKLIFKDDYKYHKNTILTAYENQEIGFNKIYNSMDYRIVSEIDYDVIDIPYICEVDVVKFQIKDELDGKVIDITILDESKIDSNKFLFIAKRLDELRVNAINETNYKRKSKLWKMYYDAFNSFSSPLDLIYEGRIIRKKTLDLGYALTIHKVQGTTLENVYIDIKSINICRNEMERRQLKYVALSRAKNNIYLYND